MEQTKLKRFKRILCTFILSIIFNTSLNSYTFTNNNDIKYRALTHITKNENAFNKKDSIKNEIIIEVKKYILKQSPKSHKNIPEYIVNGALNHNIDICFIMAQTQLETNFGTLGVGREVSRRSMFGVAGKKYLNYQDAVNDYCKILRKSYLVRGRTEQHLLTKYVTYTGKRYAANMRYEKELSTVYRNILSKTKISSLQTKFNRLS